MGSPSPKHAPEFKRQAAALYESRGGTYAGIARELGCDAGSVSDRVRKADAAEAALEIFDRIECFYGRARAHSALGWPSPDESESRGEEEDRSKAA